LRPILLDPQELPPPDVLAGAVVCEEVRIGGKRAFRKGHRIAEGDLTVLEQCDHRIPVVILGDSDIHEDDAAIRLAELVSGDGLSSHGPVQSRVNLKSVTKGLLRVDQDALARVNHIPDLSVFTMIDRIAVMPGKTVAGIKITPIATDRKSLEAVAEITDRAPIVQVKPFMRETVGVVSTEGMDDSARQRFRDSVISKIDWYGGRISTFLEVPDQSDAVADAFDTLRKSGVDLIMSGGGNTINPFDPAINALNKLGAHMIRSGVPAHPGSMFWLAYVEETPIFNLASCSMYSKSTVADLVLPWIMAGENVETRDMDGIGYGGLLDRDMKFRFPPYEDRSSSLST
jgi:Probable molybdopterin binding domain